MNLKIRKKKKVNQITANTIWLLTSSLIKMVS